MKKQMPFVFTDQTIDSSSPLKSEQMPTYDNNQWYIHFHNTVQVEEKLRNNETANLHNQTELITNNKSIIHRLPAIQSLTETQAPYQQLLKKLKTQHVHEVISYLLTHRELFRTTLKDDQLHSLFALISQRAKEPSANFINLQAMYMMRIGDFAKAYELLQQAQQLYWQEDRQVEALQCAIDIARSHFYQNSFDMAVHYLTDRAKPLLDQNIEMRAEVRANYLLEMANLATDTGHLHVSTQYALEALEEYVEAKDIYGQFRVQLRIARNYMQCGIYSEAQSRLQLIRQYFHIGKLGATAEGHLLNAEIHLQWYQHNWGPALRLGQLYLKLADHERLPYAQVYACMLLANIYRDKEDYRCAEEWYEATENLVRQQGYHFYEPWIYAQRAWLLIRQGELEEADFYCAKALTTNDRGERMSFQVESAVSNLLQGRYVNAKKQLEQSLSFYEDSGDTLASCAIRIYLAYVAMQRENTSDLLHYLEDSFGPMENLQITALPYWWHPQLVAEVCCQAIAADVYPYTVKEIITERLQKHSTTALTKLLKVDDLDVREQAKQLLSKVTGENITLLSHLEDSPAKRILQSCIEKGILRAEGYNQLEIDLMTAKLRHSPNATIIAVFVLHICGTKRTAIAEQLGCSIENVRNYITTIYRRFHLPANEFRSREERRLRLGSIARERGYM